MNSDVVKCIMTREYVVTLICIILTTPRLIVVVKILQDEIRNHRVYVDAAKIFNIKHEIFVSGISANERTHETFKACFMVILYTFNENI